MKKQDDGHYTYSCYAMARAFNYNEAKVCVHEIYSEVMSGGTNKRQAFWLNDEIERFEKSRRQVIRADYIKNFKALAMACEWYKDW